MNFKFASELYEEGVSLGNPLCKECFGHMYNNGENEYNKQKGIN